ncbi:hypothetical protein [Kocuria salsicia]|uniref:hypothetical protein n=1 Tax=Kocuria salsicia TaxID=664639 RepID=UPI0006D837F0|nr:hypothetical protein [Kocuria salsicia]
MTSALGPVLQLLSVLVAVAAVLASVGVLRGPTVRTQHLAASVSNLKELLDLHCRTDDSTVEDKHLEVARKELRFAVGALSRIQQKGEPWRVLAFTSCGVIGMGVSNFFTEMAPVGVYLWQLPAFWFAVVFMIWTLIGFIVLLTRRRSLRTRKEFLAQW